MRCKSPNCAESTIPTFSIDSHGYAAASDAQKVIPYFPGIGCFEFRNIIYVLDGDCFGIRIHYCICNDKHRVCIKIVQRRETIDLLVSLKGAKNILDQLACNFSSLFTGFIQEVDHVKTFRSFCKPDAIVTVSHV